MVDNENGREGQYRLPRPFMQLPAYATSDQDMLSTIALPNSLVFNKVAPVI
jgi:hypothetical protein